MFVLELALAGLSISNDGNMNNCLSYCSLPEAAGNKDITISIPWMPRDKYQGNRFYSEWGNKIFPQDQLIIKSNGRKLNMIAGKLGMGGGGDNLGYSMEMMKQFVTTVQ